MGLLQFLRENCSDAPSVKAIKRAIDGKLCRVNSRIETFSSYPVVENDSVVLDESAFAVQQVQQTVKPTILYEDDELLIINKPAGLLSENIRRTARFGEFGGSSSGPAVMDRDAGCVPDTPKERSIADGLLEWPSKFTKPGGASYKAIKKSLPEVKAPLELVHRLDKETSGALVLAKTAAAKKKMIALFKERLVSKVYLALVDGAVAKAEGTIDNYLGKKHSYEGQTVYGSVEEKRGQRAITHWRVHKRGKSATLLSCEPYTGRTHQLRAHLSGMGHPILGDAQYSKKFICHLRPKRNLLHAYTVAFKHPTTGKPIKATAPIPLDFKQALDELIK